MTDFTGFRLKEILRHDLAHRLVCLHMCKKGEAENFGEAKESAENDDNGRKNSARTAEVEESIVEISSVNSHSKTDGGTTVAVADFSASAVLIAQKIPFTEESIKSLLNDKTALKTIVQNDVYANCELILPAEFNVIKGTLIYPATDLHIEKYREHPSIMVLETYEDYLNITAPFIEKTQLQFSLQWVYNILDHKAESDRVLFEDADEENGFMLLPDLKWDGKSLDSLYFTAIVRQRGIKSVRSLTAKHLPLLQNIRREGCKAVEKAYGIRQSQLRIFFHYQPSYYHLHVHFVSLKAEPIGADLGHAQLLDDVIDNIEMNGNYYQQKSLHFLLKENHPLVNLLRKDTPVVTDG